MRKLYAVIFAFITIFSTYAYAEGRTVVDDADWLESYEELAVEERMEELKAEYQIDVAVVIVNSIGGKSAQAYADDYYDYNGYGMGVNDDGLLLLISKNEREYHITTHEKAVQIFNDSALEYMCSEIEEELRDGDYYGACIVFADTVDEIAYDYANGDVYADSNYDENYSIGLIAFSPIIGHILLVSLIIAGILTVNAYKGMNTARKKTDAAGYVKQGSFNLTRTNDIFLFTNTTKTKIESSSGSSRGGRTHRSSSGRSHGGRGGRF